MAAQAKLPFPLWRVVMQALNQGEWHGGLALHGMRTRQEAPPLQEAAFPSKAGCFIN